MKLCPKQIQCIKNVTVLLITGQEWTNTTFLLACANLFIEPWHVDKPIINILEVSSIQSIKIRRKKK